MPKVFISHSSKDNEISRQLAEYLERDGADIWIDYTNISGGDSLPDKISDALQWCDTLVLLWSASAVSSYYVGLEWKNALDLQKKIIPCIIDSTERPAILRSTIFIDFKDIEIGYPKLANALGLVTPQKERKRVPEKIVANIKPPALKVVSSPRFRSTSTHLSEQDVTELLKKHDFFDSRKNRTGLGFDNQYEAQTIGVDEIVIDKATGLIWQQSGSSQPMNYVKAKKWIEDLNLEWHADYNDWRLPTLEEAMSLIESERNPADLFINPIFNADQGWIWTSDLAAAGSETWVVDFHKGRCYGGSFNSYGIYVRAVRSG